MNDLSEDDSTSAQGSAPSSSGECKVAVLGLGKYSGASFITLHLTRELARISDVAVFVGREAKNLAAWRTEAPKAGFTLAVFPIYTSFRDAMLRSIVPLRIRRVAAAIRATRPDVVLVPMTHLWVLPIMRRVRDAVWIVTIHDPEPHPGIHERITWYLDRAVARRADRILTHSEMFVDVISENWTVPKERITFVPIGPLGEFTATEDIAAMPTERPYTVLFFGRFRSYKGLDVLLNAAPLVAAQRPDIRILLVGSGADAQVSERVAACTNVEMRSGWIDDDAIPSIFSAVDLVVLPYTSATQSGVIPQAAAFGLPIIASDVGGLAEQLNGGECGRLVPPGDHHALAEAILALANDEVASHQLGAALRSEYLEVRSWANVARSILAVGQEAIGRARAHAEP